MNGSGEISGPTTFLVVANDEQMYAVWPAGRDIPAGWLPTGAVGTSVQCRAFVEERWTDMRPKKLRERMSR